MGVWVGNVYIGDAGRDEEPGRTWFETISGNGGDDVLNGGTRADSVSGGIGNDVLNDTETERTSQAGGIDTLDGGDNDDFLWLSVDTYNDVLRGGRGIDTLVFNTPSLAAGVVMAGDISRSATVTNSASRRVEATLSEFEAVRIRTGTGNDSLLGGSGNDLIWTNRGRDWASSGAGNDSIRVNIDDVANVANFADTIDLGLGADKFTADFRQGRADLKFALAKGTGVGTVWLGAVNAVAATIRNAESFHIMGGFGNDVLDGSKNDIAGTRLNGDGNETLEGGAGNDILNGHLGANVLKGGPGNDLLKVFADGKFDSVFGGDDDDGSEFYDTLTIVVNPNYFPGEEIHTALVGPGIYEFSYLGAVRLYAAGIEAVVVNGSDVNDTLIGLAQADTLKGHAGADTIESGEGNDVIAAGEGNDSVNAGKHNDRVSLGGGDDSFEDPDGIDFVFAEGGNDNVMAGPSADKVFGGDGHDSLGGGPGPDTLEGDGGNDALTGAADNDSMAGGFGNDTLDGGGGNDVLSASPGNDRLIGNAGIDTMTGGAGFDRFYFPNIRLIGDGTVRNDVITDFESFDRLELVRAGFQGLSNDRAGTLYQIDQPVAGRWGVFIYNDNTGALGWDSDGIGAGQPDWFLTLQQRGGAAAELAQSQFILV